MSHYMIITGGRLDDGFVCGWIASHPPDRILAADSGMEYLYRNRMRPDIIVGDFDSADRDIVDFYRKDGTIRFRELNPVKDETDTESAIRLAIASGASEITLLGATGTRLDHVLGNLELLGIGLLAGVPITLLDEHNRVRMLREGITLRKAEQFGTYLSLLPYTAEVTGLTLRGVKYPLTDYCLRGFCSIGISNEIDGEEAVISFREGILLMIESRD